MRLCLYQLRNSIRIEKPSYNVTLDAMGGDVSPSRLTVYYDGTYGTLPTPIRSGYTFNGWFTSSGSKVTSNSEIVSKADHQGSQYKSRKIADFLKDHELQRSMSRKANCWDNAPQESFFGHMKDEIDLSKCTTFQDVVAVIDDYMDYYNTERYQWDLAKLAPAEYYQYCVSGDYPLEGICKPPPRGSAPDPEV